MSYSEENIRKAILSVMVKEPGKQWKKEDILKAAYEWLVVNNITYEDPQPKKEFEELVESNDIGCNLCNNFVGNAEQIFNHVENIHPEEFRKAANSVLKRKEFKEKK